MREVNILYTFADETILHLDESHTLRVDADLIDFKINRYIDDILIDSRPFEEFLDDLSMLNFGEMVGFSDEQIKQVKEKDNIQEPTENYSEYIGREITVDGSKFIVDSISAEFGSVSLRDATFQEKAGYPIFRGESIEWLKNIIQEQTQAQTELPPPNIQRPQPVQNTVIYPEIPQSERHNFTITDDELGYGTASEKYAANVAAIRTLKQVEAEHRLATPEEQETLSRYVGWGGLADCFEEKHSKYNELKSLLTNDEYEQARTSVLTSHYTPPGLTLSKVFAKKKS